MMLIKNVYKLLTENNFGISCSIILKVQCEKNPSELWEGDRHYDMAHQAYYCIMLAFLGENVYVILSNSRD